MPGRQETEQDLPYRPPVVAPKVAPRPVVPARPAPAPVRPGNIRPPAQQFYTPARPNYITPSRPGAVNAGITPNVNTPLPVPQLPPKPPNAPAYFTPQRPYPGAQARGVDLGAFIKNAISNFGKSVGQGAEANQQAVSQSSKDFLPARVGRDITRSFIEMPQKATEAVQTAAQYLTDERANRPGSSLVSTTPAKDLDAMDVVKGVASNLIKASGGESRIEVNPVLDQTINRAIESSTGGALKATPEGVQLSEQTQALGLGGLNVAGATLTPLGELQAQTSGRLYGAARDLMDVSAQARDAVIDASSLNDEQKIGVKNALLLGDAGISLINDPQAKQVAIEAWQAGKDAANAKGFGAALEGGRDYFMEKLPLAEQVVASFLLPDPLDFAAAAAFGSKATRWNAAAGDVAEFALLQSGKSLDEVSGLVKTGELWGGNPIVGALERLNPTDGATNLFQRTPEAATALAADNAIHFTSKLVEGKGAGEAAEILEGVVKFADGKSDDWIKIADKYGLSPRTLTAEDAARYKELAQRAGLLDFSKNKLVAGAVVSPLESDAGQAAALVLQNVKTPKSKIAKWLVEASEGFGPNATPAQKLIARQAEKNLLGSFLAGADNLTGAGAARTTPQKVYDAWRGYQGALAQLQLATPGRVVRDALTSITDGLIDGVLLPPGSAPKFFEKWGDLPAGARRGVGMGAEASGAGWFKGARNKLEEAALAQGGLKGKATQFVADTIGGPAKWAGLKEDFFAEMPLAKGMQWVTDKLWRGKQVIPPEMLDDVILNAGQDIADDFTTAISNSLTHADIDAAEAAALGGELYRYVPENLISPLREAGLLEDVQDIARTAESDADFIRLMNEHQVKQTQKVQKAATGALVPPDADFLRYATARAKEQGLTDEFAKATAAQREAKRAAKVTAQGMAKDTVYALQEQDPALFNSWLKKFEELRAKFDVNQNKQIAAEQMIDMAAAREFAREQAARMGITRKADVDKFVKNAVVDVWESYAPKWASAVDEEIGAWHNFRNQVEELLSEPVVDDASAKQVTDALSNQGAVSKADVFGEADEVAPVPPNQTADIQPAAPPPLPKELAGSKPRYGYRGKNFQLVFESDADRALYIIANPNTSSKREQGFMAWLREAFPGVSDDELRAMGQSIRQRIKQLAATTNDADVLRIPTGSTPKVATLKTTTAMPSPVNPATATIARVPYENRLLSKTREAMLKNWGKTYDNVTEQGAASIKKAADTARERLFEHRLVAEKFGTELRDAVFFNYGDRRNLDTALGLGYAYPYWYSREMAAYGRRLLENPHAVWWLWSLHDKIADYNAENENIPDWMRSNISRELGDGGLLSFPILANLDPTYSIWSPNFTDPDLAKDPAGQAYLALQSYGPGSLHGGIPMALGLMAQWAGKRDVAQSYAGYMSLPTKLAAGAAAYLPEDNPFRLRPPIPEATGFGHYSTLVADTPDGQIYVGTKYDQKRISEALSQMVESGQITPEMAEQVLFITSNPFDAKRYANSADYKQAYKIFGDVIAKQRQGTIWQPTSPDAFTIDAQNPIDLAMLKVLQFSAEKFGGIPGPALLSFLGGPALRYRTATEMEVVKAQQEYSAIRDQRDALVAQGPEGVEKYRQMVKEFWQAHEGDAYSLYVMTGKKGPEMDEDYAWSVLSRLGKGVLDNPYLEAAGVDPELLQQFYDAGGIPPDWTRNTYDLEKFMESISVLGAVMAAPELATADEWDSVSAQRKDIYAEFEKQWTPEQLAAYETYKFGDVDHKAYIADNPFISDMLTAEADAVLSNPQVAAYYASDSMIRSHLWGGFYDEHTDAKAIVDTYAELQKAAEYDDVAKEIAKDYKAENKETIDAYWDDYHAFKAEIGDKLGEVRNSLPDVKLPEIRADVEDTGVFTGRVEQANAEQIAEQNKLYAPIEGTDATETIDPKGAAAKLIAARRAEVEAEMAKEVAKQTYVTAENKDTWAENWLGDLVADFGQDAEAYYDAPITDKWLPYPNTAQSLDSYVGDAASIREAIMLDDGKAWTRIVAGLMQMTPEQLQQLARSDDRFADAAVIAQQAQRFEQPSLAAMLDILGLTATVYEDGSVSISRKRNLDDDEESGASGGGAGGQSTKKGGKVLSANGEDMVTPLHPSVYARQFNEPEYRRGYGGGGPQRRRSGGTGTGGDGATGETGGTDFGAWTNFAQAFGDNPATQHLVIQLMDYFDQNPAYRAVYLQRFPELAALIQRLGDLSALEQAYFGWVQASGRDQIGAEIGGGRSRSGSPMIQRFYPRRSQRSGLPQ